YFHRGSSGNWIVRGFGIALGLWLLKVVGGVLLLVAMTIWESREHASPGVHRFVRGSLIAVAQPGSAPALGGRYLILTIPFPSCISIVSKKLANRLLVHS